jgi:hypothetical protein
VISWPASPSSVPGGGEVVSGVEVGGVVLGVVGADVVGGVVGSEVFTVVSGLEFGDDAPSSPHAAPTRIKLARANARSGIWRVIGVIPPSIVGRSKRRKGSLRPEALASQHLTPWSPDR